MGCCRQLITRTHTTPITLLTVAAKEFRLLLGRTPNGILGHRRSGSPRSAECGTRGISRCTSSIARLLPFPNDRALCAPKV